MAPNLGTKSNRGDTAAAPPPVVPDAAIKATLATIAEAQAKALQTSEWVGTSFAERARAMHAGSEPEAAIHGRATREEARALIDDGVPVAPLIIPFVPPEARN